MPTYTTKGFTGQYADAVTGLDYYNARYYDPVAGVFLSADSVQGNIQGMNPYGYVGGNPETDTDPTGRCPLCILGAIVGGAVGVIVGAATIIIPDVAEGKPIDWNQVGDSMLRWGIAGILEGAEAPILGPLADGIGGEAFGLVASIIILGAAGAANWSFANYITDRIETYYGAGSGQTMPQISADGLPEFKKQNNPITLPAQPSNDVERTVRIGQGITTEGVRMVHAEQGTTSEGTRMISAGQEFSREYGDPEMTPWRPTPSLPSSILIARLAALRW